MNQRIKNIIKYLFSVLVKILIFMLIVIIIYLTYELVIYFQKSHKYAQDEISLEFKEKMSAFGENSYCINTLENNNECVTNREYSLILFVARAKRKNYRGHAWTIWMKAVLLDNGDIKINEFKSAGYGPNVEDVRWTDEQIEFYNNHIRSKIPKKNRQTVENILKALNYGPKTYIESEIKITKEKPMIIETKNIAQMISNDAFGENPNVMTMVIVDDKKYDKSKKIYNDFSTSNYRVLINDCSTVIFEISESLGMYAPARFICPYPEDTIKYLASMNEK